MRYRHPHGHAYVDASSPRAWATCDSCGFLWNLQNLDFQREWEGPQLANQHFLVCWRCKDKPQEQFRTIVPPADPVDITDPRPDIYVGEGTIPVPPVVGDMSFTGSPLGIWPAM